MFRDKKPGASLERSKERFYPLRYHPVQARLAQSQARFKVIHAGRRSGKTELEGKRLFVQKILKGSRFPDPRYFIGAPTRDQAKRIYWNDLKTMIPQDLILDKSESELSILLVHNVQLFVMGMDKPERVEGTPWDGCVLDEIGSMKDGVWEENVRPALADRQGWASFVGVPEGMNHYFRLKEKALKRYLEALKRGKIPTWEVFHWRSKDILPPEEIEELEQDMDKETARQELDGEYVNFQGNTYYTFSRKNNCAALRHLYNPERPLLLMFDFNVSPGVAAVGQEFDELPTPQRNSGTGIIDEVWVKKNSNTRIICYKLLEKYRKHAGKVYCYGDASGGAKGSAKIKGSDWDIIKYELGQVFGDRLNIRVRKRNPPERARINAVNSRIVSANGKIKFMVDPETAEHTVEDFEIVESDSSGAIIKTSDGLYTHLSDAIGYYVEREHPVRTTTNSGTGY